MTEVVPEESTFDGVQLLPAQSSIEIESPGLLVVPVAVSETPSLGDVPAENDKETEGTLAPDTPSRAASIAVYSPAEPPIVYVPAPCDWQYAISVAMPLPSYPWVISVVHPEGKVTEPHRVHPHPTIITTSLFEDREYDDDMLPPLL